MAEITDKWWLDTNSIYLSKENWDKLSEYLIDNTKIYISIKELYDIVGGYVKFHAYYTPNNIKAFEKQYVNYYIKMKNE